jgi:hypothetical protein
MVNEWNLRIETLNAAHRWYVVMLFVLVGSLIGVAIAYLYPAPYRAESSLHVAYSADVHLRNPDDYKNWQMEQLNILILSPAVLQETRERLATQSDHWDAVSLNNLDQNLHVYWRNAGEWQLVAEAGTPEQAQVLVNTWEQVILEQIKEASDHASTTLELSTRVDNLNNQLLDVRQRALELEQISQSLQEWIQSVGDTALNQPLETRTRWFLLAQVAAAARWNPEGKALIEFAPPADAPASDYIPWLEKTLAFIEQELASLQPQEDQLATEYEQEYAQWYQERDASQGLTAYLVVKPLEGQRAQVQAVRSTGMMAFVGGLLGLLAWMLVWLARPLRRGFTRP